MSSAPIRSTTDSHRETDDPRHCAVTAFRTSAGAVWLLLFLIIGWAFAGQRLLQRPFWMDEVHSWLLITDTSVPHALAALADGADYNPPTYFLAARTLAVTGPITEYKLRLLSLGLTICGMLAVYLMLARRFSSTASVAATLFAAGHPLLVLQSTEVRFYGLWMCLLMWYCWLLTAHCDSHLKMQMQRFSLTCLVAAICTTHYFGVISVALVTVAWAVCQRRNRRAIMLSVGLLSVAVISVACCLPLLQGQKAALTCATWVKPPTISGSADYLTQFLPLWPLSICVTCAAGTWFIRQQTAANHVPSSSPPWDGSRLWSGEHTVLLSLLLMPVTLIGFSWFVQPALVNRYATVAVTGMVPVYAWLLSKSALAMQRLSVGIVGLLTILAIQQGAATWNHSLQQQHQLRQALANLPDDQLVIFEDRIDFWLLQHQTPRATWYQVDFEQSDLRCESNLRTVQRDVGRRIARWYPQAFPMKAVDELRDVAEFVVVPYPSRPFGELKYPREFQTQQVGDRTMRLTQQSHLVAR